MMRGLAAVVLIGVLCAMPCVVHGVSVSCMMAYDEGGAPAVLSSLECPRRVFNGGSSINSTRNCQFAMLQGRREYQEDRIACNLDLNLPFSVEGGLGESTVSIVAVFDGHGGEEASEMASMKLIDYFFIHAVVIAYKRVLPSNRENHDSHSFKSSQMTETSIDGDSLHQILKEALLKTIHDIDLEFSKEAVENGYISGCTGIIVLLLNGQFLIANIGDSKALLCSQKVLPYPDAAGGSLIKVYSEELTRDHHPDRKDEKARIEAAGGFVTKWDTPRVNGVLAVSRAIGDVSLKRYGVTADPEITSWRSFGPESSCVVVASDGLFETLTPQDVCELIHDEVSESGSKCISSPSPRSLSLANRVVQQAFRAGSTDNLSAVVVADLHKCRVVHS